MQAFGAQIRSPPSVFDPNAALKFALKMVEGQVACRARVVKDLVPVPGVLGSEARLGQVFLNLLVNAAQAFEPGGAGDREIRVASRFDVASQRVVVEVSDDGVGIPADVLPRIFEPFFTTKAVGQGTGLGLFVCLGIVRDLNGEITVESEVGKGTTFRVLLPAVGSALAPVRARPRVLVVDDEPLLGASLKRYFAHRFDVEPVGDPAEALKRIRSGEVFQFVTIDLKMPGMSGPEFLARLRVVNPELARRAVVVTATSLGGAALAFTEEGRPTLMSKPVDLARLEALVEAAVEGD
jgi:CheY-like chemotaxis protein